MGIFDVFRNRSDPISRKEKMRKIRQSGKDGEEQFRRDKAFSNIERKHHGKDFEEKVRDYDGKTRKIPWEVKRNNSPLSPKQKKTRNLHVRRYVDTPYGVESRTEDKHGNKLEHNILSGKYEKVKKTNSFSLFGSDSNTKKKKTTKKKSKSSSTSVMDTLFGSSKSKSSKPKSRKKKQSRSNAESLWGSNNSSGSLFGSNTKKKPTSKKKSKSSSTSVMDTLFGSSKPKSRKSKSSGVSLWGDSKPTKSRKKKSSSDSLWGSSSNVDIWGSSSSGKKRKKKSDGIW
jgi:hypothetical protein